MDKWTHTERERERETVATSVAGYHNRSHRHQNAYYIYYLILSNEHKMIQICQPTNAVRRERERARGTSESEIFPPLMICHQPHHHYYQHQSHISLYNTTLWSHFFTFFVFRSSHSINIATLWCIHYINVYMLTDTIDVSIRIQCNLCDITPYSMCIMCIYI